MSLDVSNCPCRISLVKITHVSYQKNSRNVCVCVFVLTCELSHINLWVMYNCPRSVGRSIICRIFWYYCR